MCQYAVRYVLAYISQRLTTDKKSGKFYVIMMLQVSELYLGRFNMVITEIEFLLITLLTCHQGYLIFLTPPLLPQPYGTPSLCQMVTSVLSNLIRSLGLFTVHPSHY